MEKNIKAILTAKVGERTLNGEWEIDLNLPRPIVLAEFKRMIEEFDKQAAAGPVAV